jgi:hypothetical protein
MLTTAILIGCLRLVGKGEDSLWHIFLAAVVSQLCVYGGIFLLGSYLGSLSVLIVVPVAYLAAYATKRLEGRMPG